METSARAVVKVRFFQFRVFTFSSAAIGALHELTKNLHVQYNRVHGKDVMYIYINLTSRTNQCKSVFNPKK